MTPRSRTPCSVLQIKSAGYLTKISAQARADVGGMTTASILDGQQVKWNYGAIDLMWPGQRGDTKGQPFHPNLRLRWAENFGMATNIFTRIAFLMLLAASLSIHAFVFSPVWLIPPVVAILLNVRIAYSMKDRTWRDIAFAALGLPAEIYMWLRAGHFVRAWAKFLSKVKVDNWAEQAKAEHGSGNSYLTPLIVLAVSFARARLHLVPAAGPDPVLDPVAWLAGALRRHHRPDRRDGRQAVPPPARLPGLTPSGVDKTGSGLGFGDDGAAPSPRTGILGERRGEVIQCFSRGSVAGAATKPPPRRIPVRSRQRLALLASAVTGLVMTGCGTPPWQQASETTPTPVLTSTVSASPTPTPSATVKAKNDLAKGSAKRQLGAGGVTLAVNYWSTLSMSQWSPTATKPLSLSLNGRFTDGSTQDIFLNNVTVAIDVHGPEGQLEGPENLTDIAPVVPGYLITAPSAYVKVFNLPGLDPKAESITLNLTYELLVQRAPKSKVYLKQSAGDTLVIALTS